MTPLENIEVNDGENVLLQVNFRRLINFQVVGKGVKSLSVLGTARVLDICQVVFEESSFLIDALFSV